MPHHAVSKIKIDQALIRHAGFKGHALEIEHYVL